MITFLQNQTRSWEDDWSNMMPNVGKGYISMENICVYMASEIVLDSPLTIELIFLIHSTSHRISETKEPKCLYLKHLLVKYES